MMTDALIPQAKKLTEPRIAGVRGPKRRYALIDFETAIVDYSPELLAGFKKDVRDLASALEFNLRVSRVCSCSRSSDHALYSVMKTLSRT